MWMMVMNDECRMQSGKPVAFRVTTRISVPIPYITVSTLYINLSILIQASNGISCFALLCLALASFALPGYRIYFYFFSYLLLANKHLYCSLVLYSR